MQVTVLKTVDYNMKIGALLEDPAYRRLLPLRLSNARSLFSSRSPYGCRDVPTKVSAGLKASEVLWRPKISQRGIPSRQY